MAWIRTIDEDEATGLLARIYEGAKKRGGRVSPMIKAQSQHPPALKSMIDLYTAVMMGESPLSLGQREMVAVVISKTNGCRY